MIPQSKIVGGKFGFPIQFSKCADNSTPVFLQGDPVLLFNARSGIKLIVDHLKPTTIWLPSYLCQSIISAVDTSITKIAFYPIGDQLKVQTEDFITEIRSDDLFLFIDYFGFPFDIGMLEKIRLRGCKVFRDCSQALFFERKEDFSDFHLYSPRKFLGVPDGGILHWNKSIAISVPSLSEPDHEVLYPLLQALIQRRDFDFHGGDKEWLSLFRQGESRFKPEYRSMSQLTHILLMKAFSYDCIKLQRKENYVTLTEKLGKWAIFDDLPDHVTPLGFPIKHSMRDFLQKTLFGKNIFPTIHWDLSTAIPLEFEESHLLSKQILMIPCDQRYTKEDMNYIADAVLEIIE